MSTPIRAETARRRFTVDEYYRMGEAGIFTEQDRVELVEGEILQMTPVSSRHAACVKRLNGFLVTLLGSRAVVGVQDPIRIDMHSMPQPDIVLLHPSQDTYASEHPGPDDVFLIVEVSESSLAYDRGTKARVYARAGIPELWIVDLNGERVEVFSEPGPDGCGKSTTRLRRESLSPAAFPDISITVDSVLG